LIEDHDSIYELPSSTRLLTWSFVFSIILSLAILRTLFTRKGNFQIEAPYVGSHYSWFARLGFFVDAPAIVTDGYSRFKNEVFKICGNDVIVLPQKYLNEVRRIPEKNLSAMKANLANMQSGYTLMDVLGQTKLFIQVIQTRLNPKLGPMIPIVRNELDFAFEKEMPPCEDEWVAIGVWNTLHSIVGRTSARLFVGPDLCRNEYWLHTVEGYTHNVFKTTVALRLFPSWAKTFGSFFIPFHWQIQYNYWHTTRILTPHITRRMQERATAQEAGISEKPTAGSLDNLLELMMDEAKDVDKDPVRLVKMVLSLTLASNHTTTMALTEALYDLCAHPEYIPALREEVRQAVAEDEGWRKTTLTKMRKLDSFIKESQRVNPPSFMGYKRSVLEPLTLSDGLKLPAKTHFELAIVPIQREYTENSEVFDGFRYYRLRQKPEESHRHQFATTDPTTLHFGYGQHSCPGRFMASNVIKMVLGTLLLEYDFRFAEGQTRPKSIKAFEYSFPNPTAQILFKKLSRN